MIIFAIVFVFIVIMIIFTTYRACRASQNRRLDQIAATSTYDVTRLPQPTRKIMREVLPRECDECGAPLKYSQVKWTGPRRAECPFCGHAVELELVETTIEE